MINTLDIVPNINKFLPGLNYQVHETSEICWSSINNIFINNQEKYSELNIETFLKCKRYRSIEYIYTNKFEQNFLNKIKNNDYFMESEKEIQSDEEKENISFFKSFNNESINDFNDILNLEDISKIPEKNYIFLNENINVVNSFLERSENYLNENLNVSGLLLEEREKKFDFIFNNSNNILNQEKIKENDLSNINQENQDKNFDNNISNEKSIFKVKAMKQRGRKIKIDKKRKNHKKHKNTAFDNTLIKVQSHFMNFLIALSNMVINAEETKEKNLAFYDIDYKIKKDIKHNYFEELRNSKISEIFKYPISKKYKKIGRNNNEIVYNKVINLSENTKKYFDMNYLDLFKQYYNKCEPLKKIVINGKQYSFTNNIKSFYYLIQKHKDNEESRKALIENTKNAYFSDFKIVEIKFQKNNLSKKN